MYSIKNEHYALNEDNGVHIKQEYVGSLPENEDDNLKLFKAVFVKLVNEFECFFSVIDLIAKLNAYGLEREFLKEFVLSIFFQLFFKGVILLYLHIFVSFMLMFVD